MAVVVRFRAVLGDGCVGGGKPGFPAGRARFLVAGEGPPLLVLHAIDPRPLEDVEKVLHSGSLGAGEGLSPCGSHRCVELGGLPGPLRRRPV